VAGGVRRAEVGCEPIFPFANGSFAVARCLDFSFFFPWYVGSDSKKMSFGLSYHPAP
jgi:hypothetical protein